MSDCLLEKMKLCSATSSDQLLDAVAQVRDLRC